MRVQSAHTERVTGDRSAAALGDQRQLAAAIGKALVDVKVPPELRDQVGAVIAAEGAKRVARAERFEVLVHDSRAPRDRSEPGPTGAHQPGDRERSR